MTTQRICKCICKVCKICKKFECTKCKNTEVKIKDSLFCEILSFIQIFALQFVRYDSNFHQNSKIALAISEYRNSFLQKTLLQNAYKLYKLVKILKKYTLV